MGEKEKLFVIITQIGGENPKKIYIIAKGIEILFPMFDSIKEKQIREANDSDKAEFVNIFQNL